MKVIDPLANAFIVNPSQTTVITENGAKVVDTREMRIEELEKQVEKLRWRINDLEERVFGYHD